MPRVTRSPLSTRSLKTLVGQLPLPALLPLGAAIFCLFAVLGPVVDVLGGGQMPIPATIRIAALSGLWAVGYAYGSLRRNWYVFYLTGASHLLWTLGLFHNMRVAIPARSRSSSASTGGSKSNGTRSSGGASIPARSMNASKSPRKRSSKNRSAQARFAARSEARRSRAPSMASIRPRSVIPSAANRRRFVSWPPP